MLNNNMLYVDTDRNNITPIYRYKFKNEFTDELYKFSKIHQYDHRKDFKEAWSKWVEENDDIVSEETVRLKQIGYDGDIVDKMFKSARYYFRKKSTEKKAPRERRDYIGVSKEIIDAMDTHIDVNIKNIDYKPSDGFDSYYTEESKALKEEIQLFKDRGINLKEIQQKIKKTYKNRYFLYIQNKK